MHGETMKSRQIDKLVIHLGLTPAI